MSEYILEMNHIMKSFPGVQVLNDVTLQVKPGEVHALMGENGAGKSTLMKILMGIYSADAGEVVLNGRKIMCKNPHDAMSHGIAMIHQELNPILDMQVFENVFIGREKRTALGLVDKAGMLRETRSLLASLNIDIPSDAYMRDLSVAQCQLIEIVKAISINARVVVMDEPTSAITEREVETLFSQIGRLKSEGVSIIYISHKMKEIFAICDTVTVLRDGHFIGTNPTGELTTEQLIRMMVGRDIAIIYGPMGSDAQLKRKAGYDEILAKYPDVKVVFEETANWVTADALKLVENWLSTGKEINAVVSQNDSMAMGALKAIEDAGKQDSIPVYGLDAVSDAVKAIADGRLAGTVSQDAPGQGALGVETMVNYLNGKKVEPINYTECVWVDKSNVANYQ